MKTTPTRTIPTPQPTAYSLRSLVQSCNTSFGERLIADRDDETGLAFEDFVHVAETGVEEQPELAAIHLAGLLALDVERGGARGGRG